MAVALVALFMAMGGSAYALVVTSGRIKNNTIRSVDVRNGGCIGKDVRRDGVGGRAVKESTLATVPSAFVAHGGRAHFAVVNAGGQQVRGARHHVVRAHGGGPLPGDLRPRRARLRATTRRSAARRPRRRPTTGRSRVSSLASNVNGVDVRTTGARTATTPNKPFHLLVLC